MDCPSTTALRAMRIGLSITLAASGCSFYRGMPDHGGGKRFDEEQRALAGSIRRAVSAMDLSELSKKRTLVVVSNIYTSGGGSTTWSGAKNVSASASRSDSMTGLVRTITNPANTAFVDGTDYSGKSISGSISYQPFGSYAAANHCSEGDLSYFRAALDMKARHDGVQVVNQDPEMVLHVLVDVLGTNHSRRDFVLYAKEQLLACCEVTYYAQRADNGELAFKSRQTGAAAAYSEGYPLLLPLSKVTRTLSYYKPVYYDSQEVRPANGGHLELPDRSDELQRACRQMTDAQREEVLESLYERARAQIRSGNLDAARQNIQSMRLIDPAYKGLADLKLESR